MNSSILMDTLLLIYVLPLVSTFFPLKHKIVIALMRNRTIVVGRVTGPVITF